jgi:hypothetical protein
VTTLAGSASVRANGFRGKDASARIEAGMRYEKPFATRKTLQAIMIDKVLISCTDADQICPLP